MYNRSRLTSGSSSPWVQPRGQSSVISSRSGKAVRIVAMVDPEGMRERRRRALTDRFVGGLAPFRETAGGWLAQDVPRFWQTLAARAGGMTAATAQLVTNQLAPSLSAARSLALPSLSITSPCPTITRSKSHPRIVPSDPSNAALSFTPAFTNRDIPG